eukprot:TRINITY_DN10407_c0_g1_i4.p1 TRINITY_DN10407_c0_g1~~TRINITY_DN10407_c0_g1_i4.p1  ORF type:complete len:453 (+),score=61.49 TRINITY_DN10407_c0_g1_i4:61-1359(+)
MAATFELLRVVCDAVVELDSQHVITNAAMDLAALLLRGTDMSLQGVEFRSLLALDTDKAIFDSQVGTFETQVQRATASVIGVGISDSLGNLLRTQLLHVPFFAPDGRLRHLIGIRESADPLDEFRTDAKCKEAHDRCRRNAVKPYQMTSDAAVSAHLASRPSVVGTMVFDASNWELFFLMLGEGLFLDTLKPSLLPCGLQAWLPDCSTNNEFKRSLKSYLASFVTAVSTDQHPPASLTDISIVLQPPHSCDGHNSAEKIFANCCITLHRILPTVCPSTAEGAHTIASCCDADVDANQGNSSSNCSQDDKSYDGKSDGVTSSLIVAVACLWRCASPGGRSMETSEARSEDSFDGQESGSSTSGSVSSNSDVENEPAVAMPDGRRGKRVEKKRRSRRSSYERVLFARSAELLFGDVGSFRTDDRSDDIAIKLHL